MNAPRYETMYFATSQQGDRVLAMISVLQSYFKQLVARKQPFHAFIEELKAHKFLQPVLEAAAPVDSITFQSREELMLCNRVGVGLVFDFAMVTGSADAFSLPTKKHMTATLATLLGCNANRLPNLSTLKVPEPTVDFAYDENLGTDVLAVLTASFPGDVVSGSSSESERMQAAARAKVYVGKQDAASYFAASVGRAVTEVASTRSFMYEKVYQRGYQLVHTDWSEEKQPLLARQLLRAVEVQCARMKR